MVSAKGLEKAIENIYGKNIRIESRQPVFGGDINRAYALNLSDGSTIFMKANTLQKRGIFEGEADSLFIICFCHRHTIREVQVGECGITLDGY